MENDTNSIARQKTENSSLIEEFWNTPSAVDYGSWENSYKIEKKKPLFKIKKHSKKEVIKEETDKIQNISLVEDIKLQKKENKELIEQFWQTDIKKEIAITNDLPMSRTHKMIIIGITAVTLFTAVFFIGRNVFEKVQFHNIQKMLYELAESEVSDGSYDSAKSHFVQIDEKSGYYSEAVRMIKQIDSAKRYIEKAYEAYDEDNMELAQEEIDGARLVMEDFAECDDIQTLVDERKQQKKQQASEYIRNCRNALEESDMQEAVKNYKLAYELAKGDSEVNELYEGIRQYASERLKVGDDYYESGDMLQAQIVFNELKEFMELKELNSLYLKLSSYYKAEQLVKDARVKFESGENQEALELINQAYEMNKFTKAIGSELEQEVKTAIEEDKLMEEYKSKLEISEVAFIENEADGKYMLTAMFDMELTGLDILMFNDCWITLEKGDVTVQPTPMYEQRYAVIAKILENGQTSSDLEYDIVYMKKGEKYRVMIKFEGRKDDYIGAKLVYTDINDTQNPVKIELGKVK